MVNKSKRVVVYKDELTKEKFLKLEIVTDSTRQRTKKIDYSKLVEELNNKVITVRGIQKLMLKCSKNKNKVYYSEVLRALKSLVNQQKITFNRRIDTTTGVIYYSIQKVK